MVLSFIKKIFTKNKGKTKSYELVETKIDKRKESDSEMVRYYKEEYYKDNNDNKGNKKITIGTIAVQDNVDFEEASLKSKSFNSDNDNTSKKMHFNLHNKNEGTRNGVYTYDYDDGSHRTVSITYSHLFKDNKPLSELFPDNLKQNIKLDTNKSADSQSYIDVKEKLIAIDEPKLVIMLGPPAEEKQKLMYEKYQESRRNGSTEEYLEWERFEKHMVDFLFTRKNNLPSTIEEMFFRLLNAPTKIESYNFGMGFHRDQWVASVTIPASSVLFAKPNMKWPPNAEVINTTASIIGNILTRDWMYVFSIIPQ